VPPDEQRYSRRQCLQVGGLLLAGAGLVGGTWSRRAQAKALPMHGPELPFDPQQSLRGFERGRLIQESGRTLRLFEVEARSITVPLGGEVLFKAWTLNGRIPGPRPRDWCNSLGTSTPA
jgi:hypothetical protein